MKTAAKIVAVILPVSGAELIAKWWTEPPPPATEEPVLTLGPSAQTTWQIRDELFREVQPSLRCNGGWIADVLEADGPGLRAAYFAWDQTSTVTTLEAFKHMPDECMGSIGMKLEKVHAPRSITFHGHTLVFDSTHFRPESGALSVHVFKAIYVAGFEGTNLREGLLGSNGLELRQLRLAAAITRFKPRHTRVIMGAVAGMPSEELAWHRFSTQVLHHLSWQETP